MDPRLSQQSPPQVRLGFRPPVIVLIAMLALFVYGGGRAMAQDAVAPAPETDWERVAPGVDTSPDADADAPDPANPDPANQVLEIPQSVCKDGSSGPCDDASAKSDDDDDIQTINAPQPGAPPDAPDNTAVANAPDDGDWGSIDEYQNQPIYGIPYGMSPYGMSVVNGTMNRPPTTLAGSTFTPMAMSSPLTQPAMPLNHGPWMLPPSMSQFARPAGAPMAPMSFSRPIVGIHR